MLYYSVSYVVVIYFITHITFYIIYCISYRLITEGEPIEEPDTGGVVTLEPLHPRDMFKYHMTKQDEEEDMLEHKGGFWDQVCIAIKFLNEKVQMSLDLRKNVK